MKIKTSTTVIHDEDKITVWNWLTLCDDQSLQRELTWTVIKGHVVLIYFSAVTQYMCSI